MKPCVCFRPYQHGGDMLAAITLTLKQCNSADLATPAALALQGLQELCRAEVRQQASFLKLKQECSNVIISDCGSCGFPRR